MDAERLRIQLAVAPGQPHSDFRGRAAPIRTHIEHQNSRGIVAVGKEFVPAARDLKQQPRRSRGRLIL
ncbi:MAG: hypothetical protein DMG29_01130 [Acidobacteria bacterium]|nr:MAG: hypothetical protein DMG29_01130 [Acidobacteriota bacterium]